MNKGRVVLECIGQLRELGWKDITVKEQGTRVHFVCKAPNTVTQVIGASADLEGALENVVVRLGSPEGYPNSRKETEMPRFTQPVRTSTESASVIVEETMTVHSKFSNQDFEIRKTRNSDGQLVLLVPEGHKFFLWNVRLSEKIGKKVRFFCKSFRPLVYAKSKGWRAEVVEG